MKRLLIIAMMILGASATMMAQGSNRPWQKQLAFDIGPQFPSGDASDGLDAAIGFSGTFYYQLLTRNTFISASVGSHSFNRGTTSSLNIVPVLIGFKYNFTLTGFQPYIGMEFGAYLNSATAGTISSESETDFGVMPKFGFRYPIAAGFDFDASVKYNAVFTAEPSFSFLGINGGIAYTIE
jgi:hypothetical protein